MKDNPLLEWLTTTVDMFVLSNLHVFTNVQQIAYILCMLVEMKDNPLLEWLTTRVDRFVLSNLHVFTNVQQIAYILCMLVGNEG